MKRKVSKSAVRQWEAETEQALADAGEATPSASDVLEAAADMGLSEDETAEVLSTVVTVDAPDDTVIDGKRYKQLISAYKRKLHNAVRLGHVVQEPKGLTGGDVLALNAEYKLPAGSEWTPGAKFLPPDQQDAGE